MDKYYFIQDMRVLTPARFIIICKTEAYESTEVTIIYNDQNKRFRNRLAKFVVWIFNTM